jgi:hypothetical protein
MMGSGGLAFAMEAWHAWVWGADRDWHWLWGTDFGYMGLVLAIGAGIGYEIGSGMCCVGLAWAQKNGHGLWGLALLRGTGMS